MEFQNFVQKPYTIPSAPTPNSQNLFAGGSVVNNGPSSQASSFSQLSGLLNTGSEQRGCDLFCQIMSSIQLHMLAYFKVMFFMLPLGLPLRLIMRLVKQVAFRTIVSHLHLACFPSTIRLSAQVPCSVRLCLQGYFLFWI